jgi:ketosteroid isomerase-like protein
MSQTTEEEVKAAVLEANAGFYRAFSAGDQAAMRELWAEEAPLACLHPMSPVLTGRDAVLGSWGEILRGPPPFELRCDRPVVHVLGNVAFVTCYEASGDRPAHLAATNVFVLELGRWRMVHHQAGPLSSPVPRRVDRSTVN